MYFAKLYISENPLIYRGLLKYWLEFSNHTLQTDKATEQLTKKEKEGS
jgi:hypothetical protein